MKTARKENYKVDKWIKHEYNTRLITNLNVAISSYK